MNYKTLSVEDFKQESGIDLSKIFNFFSEKRFSDLLYEAVDNDELFSPCLSGDKEGAVCSSSFFDKNVNYLLFEGNVNFIVCQRLVLCDSLIIPDYKACIPNPETSGKKFYFKNVEDEYFKFSKGRFNGIINGYKRPYHYFYDKLPPLFDSLDFTRGKIPFCNIPGNFVDLEAVSGCFVRTDVDINSKGFFLWPSKPSYKRTPAGFFSKLRRLVLRSESVKEFPDNDVVIWLGLAKEKREWVERRSGYVNLIEKIKNAYSKPLFVFDGLTSTYNKDPQDLRSGASKSEVEELGEIIKCVGDFDFIDLIGAKASDKINIASRVDFFISSHLTDSMWCAAFNFRPGLTYRSSASIGRGSFIHPLTNPIPSHMVKDLGASSTGDHGGVSISINPHDFSEMAFHSIVITKSFNDLVKKGEVSGKNRDLFSDAFLVPNACRFIFFRKFLLNKKEAGVDAYVIFYGEQGDEIYRSKIEVQENHEIVIPSGSFFFRFNVCFLTGHVFQASSSIMLKG